MGRGFSCGNGREFRGQISQAHTMRDQQDRQEEEWSVPTSIERREDDIVRQESQRAPPTSLSEDRLFTNWSSLDSPPSKDITSKCFCERNRTRYKSIC